MTNLALVVLFLFPAFTISGQIARSIAVAMCLLCCHPKVEKKLSEPALLLFTWFIWAFFCSYMSDHFQLALFGFHKRFEGLITWILAISFGWLFWRTSSLESLYKACLSILGLCFLVMVFKPDVYKSLIYGHITIAAFVTIICCMLMAKNPAYLAILIPFIFLMQIRSMLLGLGLALIAYGILNRKQIKHLFGSYWTPWLVLIVVLPLILIAAIPKLSTISFSSLGKGARTQFAAQAIQAIAQRPFMGYGIDTLSKVLKPAKTDSEEYTETDRGDGVMIRTIYEVDRTHNFFLDILLQTGFIGLSIWLFILTRITYRTFKNPSTTNQACFYGVAAVIGFAMTNPFGVPAMFLMCLCVLGIEKEEIK
jgi:O-antigen ligase